VAVKKPAASSSDSSSDDENEKSGAKPIPAQITPKSAAILKPVLFQKATSPTSDSSSDEEKTTPKTVPVEKRIGTISIYVSIVGHSLFGRIQEKHQK